MFAFCDECGKGVDAPLLPLLKLIIGVTLMDHVILSGDPVILNTNHFTVAISAA